MFDTVNVAEWNETLHQVDLPSLQFTFSGIFTHIMLLDFGYNSTVAVALQAQLPQCCCGAWTPSIAVCLPAPPPLVSQCKAVTIISEDLSNFSTGANC